VTFILPNPTRKKAWRNHAVEKIVHLY